jgi:hypothetical protein
MAIRLFGRAFRAPEEEGGSGGGERESPAAVNQRGNNARLAMIERVGRTADGKRADELQDTDGQKVTGRFSDGEFDDSPEAREKAAEREDDEARAAREEQEDRARQAEEEETADERRARELQEEGGEEGARARQQQRREEPQNEAGDEKVVDGVKYYLTIVEGEEKWFTLKQLREHAAVVVNTEETLQRAQDALQRSSQAAPSPKDEPAEVSEADLEAIILSASVGEDEAVRKLAHILASRPKGIDTQAIGRQVAQQIATQRAIDDAEAEQQDFLGNAVLAPIFRMKLAQFAREKPKTPIKGAYQAVGEEMKRDFAAMLTKGKDPLQDKADRKRRIVTPPEGVARQRTREDDGQEPSVSSDIDAIAKTRGQARAIRQGGRNR